MSRLSFRLMPIALLAGVLALAPATSRADDPPAPAVQGPQAPSVPAEIREAWPTMGAEARWSAYRTEVARSGQNRTPWIQFLVAQQDWGTLEWIALYDHWQSAAEALANAQGPPWMRVAVWGCYAKSSHSFESAAMTMVRKHPQVAMAYLAAHREAITGPVKGVFDQLHREYRPGDVDVKGLLPPLDADEVFGALKASPLVSAEPRDDAPTVAAVLRAIRGLELSTQRPDFVRPAMLRLLVHPNEDIRRECALGLAAESKEHTPYAALAYRFSDPGESPAVREAALMAFTNTVHPRLNALLLGVAADPDHPAWRAAVSRLIEFKDFALRGFLTDQLAEHASGPKSEFIRSALDKLGAAWNAIEPDNVAATQRWMLEHAAWLELTEQPIAEAYHHHAIKLLRVWIQAPGMRAHIASYARLYTIPDYVLEGPGPFPWEPTDDQVPEGFQARVRKLAAEVLGED